MTREMILGYLAESASNRGAAMHLIWLWFWYTLGSFVYMFKRAFYSINPPNPVATGWADYVRRAGVPLLFRFVVESTIYWMCFSPFLLAAGLRYLGWERFAGTVAVITQFAPCALAFGLFADFASDWFIGTVVGKISFLNLKDWWPQMPEPLPQKAVVEAQIVEQKVTQLQTTTTVVPRE
jgi:hypothetical protein